MKNVKLWNVGEPNLHKIEVTVSENNQVTDTFEQTFGIRLVRATAKDGLTINGRHINMQGGAKMYAEDEVIIPLKELIDENMPNLSAYIKFAM